MASLGELSVRAILDIAQFSGPLSKAEKEVADFGKNISKGIDSGVNAVVSSLTNMIVGVAGVAAVMASLKESINMQGELYDMATATGATIESLDELSTVAKLNGADLGTVQKAFKELQKSAVEAQDPMSKTAAEFKTLGINAADFAKMKPQEQFELMAEKMNEFEDDAGKAAVMQDLFGKSSKEVAVILKNYKEDMEAARLITEKFGGTNEQVGAAADKIGDSFDKMAIGLQHALFPAFEKIAEIAGRLFEAFGEMGGQVQGLASHLGDALFAALQMAGSMLVGFVTTLGMASAALKGVGNILSHLATGELDKIGADFDNMGAEITKAATDGNKALTALWKETDKQAESTKKAKKPTDDLTAAHNKGSDAAKEAAKAAKELEAQQKKNDEALAKLLEKWDTFGKSEYEKDVDAYNKSIGELNTLYVAGIYGIEEWSAKTGILKAQFEEVQAKKFDESVKKISDEIGKKDGVVDLMRQWNEEEQKQVDRATSLVTSLTNETTAFGKTRVELDLANIQKERWNALYGVNDQATRDEIDALYDQAAALVQVKADQENALEQANLWKGYLDTVNSYGSDLFSGLLTGMQSIGDWAKKVGADLKKYLLQVLYDATIKPFVVSIVGSVAGAFGVSGAAQAASGFGGDAGSSAIGSAVSKTLEPLISGLGTAIFGAGGFSGAMNAFTTGMMNPMMIMGDVISGGLELASIGGAMNVLGAVAPYLAAGYLAYTLLAPKRGGPKQAGMASDISGEIFYPGETSAEANKGVADLVGGLTAQYNAIIEATGGKGTAQFALGYDTDPNGTAQNRVSGAAMVNGQLVYKQLDRNVGRDADQLNAEMETEAKRVLLAALQASELPADIAAVLSVASAATASADTVDSMLAFATAIGAVNKDAANIDKIGEALDAAMKPLTKMDEFRNAGNALDELLASYDGSAEATAKLATASDAYYGTLVQLEMQIRQVSEATSEMFTDTAKAIELAGRDAEWMKKYYSDQVAAGMASIGAETDPARIAEIAASINEGIRGAFETVDMSGMSPEQQDAIRSFYKQQADDANTAVQERLKEITTNVADATKADLAQVHDALMGAAGAMQTAANTMQTAADTPTTVNVNLTVAGEPTGTVNAY